MVFDRNRGGDPIHIFRMSSLSRRACYKCGNVGHYAEVCTSTERLCYNCKQPGHESNQCPMPRTTESKSNLRTAQRARRLTLSSSKTMLSLPGSRSRPSRLSNLAHQRWSGWWALLFMRSDRPLGT